MTVYPNEYSLGALLESRRLCKELEAQLLEYARDFRRLLRSERALQLELLALKVESAPGRLQLTQPDDASLQGDDVEGSTDGLREALAGHRVLAEQLEQAHYDTALRLGRAASLKSAELAGHSERISRFCSEIARTLEVSEDGVEVLCAAAPLHDVGKIGVPDKILLKPGPLSPEEWKAVQAHTTLGAELLASSSSRLLQAAQQIALTHHERWDGSGYPQGLRGKEIPLFGRIVNLVDQYDALRSPRPYKPPFSHDRTCQLLLHGDDRTTPEHFDPLVLTAFDRVKGRFAEIYASMQ